MSLEDQDQLLLNLPLSETEQQILEENTNNNNNNDNVDEDDLAALLGDVDTNEDAAAAATQEQQQETPGYALVWTPGETENSWLPAVLVSTNEDGTFTCFYAGDASAYQVTYCEYIEDNETTRERLQDPVILDQYNQLLVQFFSDAAAATGSDNDEKQRRKEEKRRKKEEKKQKKLEKKEKRKQQQKRGDDDDDDAAESEEEDDDEDDDDDDEAGGNNNNRNNMMIGGVDRLRRGAAGGGFNAGAVSAAPRTALDNAAAGSNDKMRGFLAKARDQYEAARLRALQLNERMSEFESDYLEQAKQQRVDELAVVRFLKAHVDKKKIKDALTDDVKNWFKNLEEGRNAPPAPHYHRVELPDRVERVPRPSPNAPPTQFFDPLLRRISPPRIDVERRPLSLRTFGGGDGSSVSGTSDANIKNLYTQNPPMKQWRALRDTVAPTPADIQEVPVTAQVARLFNEPRKKLQEKTETMTGRILGKDVQQRLKDEQADLHNRIGNTNVDLFNFTTAAMHAPTIFQRQRATLDSLPSVGPSPAHLGGATPAYTEVFGGAGGGGIMSAVPSEVAVSQIPIYDEADLGFHVDPQSLSRQRSEQSQISDISDKNKQQQDQNQNNNNNNNTSSSAQRSQSQQSASSQNNNNNTNNQQRTWKQYAARVISRILTPYLHGTHGCPMLIRDEDDFAALARELTTKAYNSKLRQLGLAPELRHAPIPESEFSEQEAAHLAAAVQHYMKERAGRRRGRSDSSSDSHSSQASSATGSSYSGPGGSSNGSSYSNSSYSSGGGSRSDYSSSAGGLTPYSAASSNKGNAAGNASNGPNPAGGRN